MTNVNVQPYLMFNGSCEEAIKYYCDIFGGEIRFVSRFSEGKMEIDVPENWMNKIMHSNFVIRGTQLMASDTMPNHPVVVGNNVYLSVNFEKDKSMDEPFKRLAEGGKVMMPLADTFWGARFGMLVDRYGVNWMFNQEKN